MNRQPRRQRTYFILLLVTAFALLTIDYHSNGAVITGLGLIGNVVRADSRTSTVQLLTDPAINVIVRNGRTNTNGKVSGLPDGNLALTQFSQTSDIRVGDQLVTRGSKDNQ